MTPGTDSQRLRIAIIGGGISGNTVAHLLNRDHDIHLFEANNYVGGHTNTVPATVGEETYAVDTGFMVFNERTYPNFCQMLQRLNVASQDSDMSFSVRCDQTRLEYQGSSLNGLFAQRANLVRPRFLGMIRDVLRFNREALQSIAEDDGTTTLRDFLSTHRYGRTFRDLYLVPMASAIWSANPAELLDFPAKFLIGFFHNHGLLAIRDRPQWKTITGGACRYVEALTKPFAHRIRINCPIESVVRQSDHVIVKPRNCHAEEFDRVVFATHADQTLKMLQDARAAEAEVLSCFPYQRNVAVLHTDDRLMPRRKRAWASWNYHRPEQEGGHVVVTYDLSRLQNKTSPRPILLTLNPEEPIDSAHILQEIEYFHPAYSVDSFAAQRRHSELNGHGRVYFCGAYWGYGFHEDGVRSALKVSEQFGVGLEACTVACTKERFGTGVAAL